MSRGFTLIEALIVLSLTILLATLAIPSYYFLVEKTQATTNVNRLIAAINLARSEAVRRQEVVAVCKSKDGQTCSGSWSQGWIVFADPSVSGKVSSPNLILRVFNGIPTPSQLEWKAQRSNDFLQLDPSGMTHGQAGTFYYYPDASHKQKVTKIIVSYTGRIRVVQWGQA